MVRYGRVVVAGALGLGLGVLSACATGGSGEEQARPVPTVRGSDKLYTNVGPGSRLERVVDPEFHMAAAQREYAAGLFISAGDEIEKLAAFVAYEARRSAGDKRRALEVLERDLEQLAKDVSRRQLDSPAALETAFARTRRVLAR